LAQIGEVATQLTSGRKLRSEPGREIVEFSFPRAAIVAGLAYARMWQDRSRGFVSPGIRIGIDLGLGGLRATGIGEFGCAAEMLSAAAAPGEVLATEIVADLSGKVTVGGYRRHSRPTSPDLPSGLSVVSIARGNSALRRGSSFGTLPDGKLVGREEVMERIRPHLQSVLSGHGQFLTVTGERGVGKTRIGQEITAVMHGMGFLIAGATCYADRAPLKPCFDVVRSLFEMAPESFKDDLRRLQPHLSGANGAGFVDLTGGPDERRQLFGEIQDILVRISGVVPLALLFDNLSAADDLSLDLIKQLSLETLSYPIFLLGAYSEDDPTPADRLTSLLGDLDRHGIVTHVEVTALDRASIADLVTHTVVRSHAADRLRHSMVSPYLADLLYEHQHGNCFDIIASVEELIDSEALFVSGTELEYRVEGPLATPRKTRRIVADRLIRLGENVNRVLGAACVLGPQFSVNELADMLAYLDDNSQFENKVVTPSDESRRLQRRRVDLALETAEAARVVVPVVEAETSQQYAFTHENYCEVLYSTLSTMELRRLHAGAGHAIKLNSRHSTAPRAADVAHHLLQSGDTGRGLKYLLQAGDEALVLYAFDTAEKHFRLALELVRQSPSPATQERFAVNSLALAISRSGPERSVEALALLREATSLHSAAGDREREWRALTEMALIYQSQGAVDQAADLLAAAAGAAPDSVGSPALSQLLGVLAALLSMGDRVEEALSVATEAIRIAELIPSSSERERVRASAERSRGMALRMLGRHEEAEESLIIARDLALKLGDDRILAHALLQMGVCYAELGQFDRARDLFHQAHGLGTSVMDHDLLEWCSWSVAWLDFWQGHWRESAKRFEEAKHDASPSAVHNTKVNLAVMRALRARSPGARKAPYEEIEHIARVTRASGDIENSNRARRWLTWIDVFAPVDGDSARGVKSQFSEESAYAGTTKSALRILTLQALRYHVLGHRKQALRDSALALLLSRRCGSWFDRRFALLCRAYALHAAGRDEPALQRLLDAAVMAESLPSPVIDCQIYEFLGRLYDARGKGKQAEVAFAHSRNLLRKLGVPFVALSEPADPGVVSCRHEQGQRQDISVNIPKDRRVAT
jgi:tetratricopeptide (TPR) repeat protein